MANIDQSTFPLLQLPKKAQRNVCRVMEPINQLGLSLCSKLIRSLVKSSGLTAKAVRVCRAGFFFQFDEQRIVYANFRKYDNQTGQTHIIAYHARFDSVDIDNNVYKWENSFGTVRDWAAYFLSVLNRRSIDYIYCADDELEFVEHNFEGLYIDQMHVGSESVEGTLQLMKGFPHAKSFSFRAILPQVEFQKVLIQNFDSLKPTNRQPLSLDDLLLCNSAHFQKFYADLTPKELNRFVRLWMKGSNPRLKSIRVSYESVNRMLDKAIILRGTNYQDQMEEMVFNLYEEFKKIPEKVTVSGGFEIFRKDGVKATIMIGRGTFQIYIWS